MASELAKIFVATTVVDLLYLVERPQLQPSTRSPSRYS